MTEAGSEGWSMRSGCPKSRGSGFTLLEMVVAGALTLIVFGLFFSVLAPVMHSSGRESVQVELQQLGLIASEKIINDLQASTPGGLTFLVPTDDTEPSGVALHRIEDVNSDGLQVWEDHLVVYYWDRDSSRLYRKEWPPTPPDFSEPVLTSRATVLDRAELWQVVVTPNGTERVLAAHVTDFVLQPANNPTGVGQPLQLHLELEAEVPGTERLERFELDQQIYIRNATL